ncbi:acyltransferase family protein [Microvirga aerophila]|uniref:Acyltransferase n=1 Tax=Microvirga aerophila TaxID=670291 RepID=A0A512BRL4_9HYPH|nr:acyltransferase [Microvirga aerophila]GEO14608.1 acyltransferase [Microvirga aerophila]
MRNLRLDSLRGIAALCVLIHHALHISNSGLVDRVLSPPLSTLKSGELWERLVLSIVNGGMAVYIFFILSGAVLMASLTREEQIGPAAMARFTIRRVLRIYPAMIVAVVVFGAASHMSLRDIAENSLLLSHKVNGGTWTLQTEMLMIPFILLVAWFWSLVGTLALVAFLFWAETNLWTGAPFAADLLNVALPAFALGMLIPSQITKDAFNKLPAQSYAVFLAGMVLARFYYPIGSTPGVIVILGLAFGAVASLYHCREQKHPFDHAALTFLGRISYSLYLWHVMVIWWPFWLYAFAFGRENVSEHYLFFGLAYAALATAITVPIAALSEKYIERPFIRMGSNLFTGSRAATRARQEATG